MENSQLFICVSLSLNHTKWMTNTFEICSWGSVELFQAGCTRRSLQSFIVPAAHLLKCLQGSAVVTLTYLNLTALSWDRNLKPSMHISCSLMYWKKLNLWSLADRLPWEKSRKSISCPLGSLGWWQLWHEMRHGYVALVSSDWKKQLNFTVFLTENKYLMGSNPVI